MRVLPAARRRLPQGGITIVQVVHAGTGRTSSLKPTDFVAIPVSSNRTAPRVLDFEFTSRFLNCAIVFGAKAGLLFLAPVSHEEQYCDRCNNRSHYD
jgi:hypothetical protein